MFTIINSSAVTPHDTVVTVVRIIIRIIPHTTKHLRGKTLSVRVENGYLLETFTVTCLQTYITNQQGYLICGKSFAIE